MKIAIIFILYERNSMNTNNNKLNKRIYKLRFLLILSLLTAIQINAKNESDYIPYRLILNLTENPANSIAVTWRTNKLLKSPKVQIAFAGESKKLINDIKNYEPTPEKFTDENQNIYYHYSKVIEDLKPDTKYLYRVGSELGWSEWNQFKTADSKYTGFKFVYFGDPQDDIKEHCSRVFREAFKYSPNVDFWLFAGDITANPTEKLWDELFYAAGFIFRIIPVVMAPGNHDHPKIFIDGVKGRSETIGNIWRAYLTQPENGLHGLEELSFYLDYQNTRFVILDSQTRLEEQAEWLNQTLSENKSKWTIITFHHPIYSTANKRRTDEIERMKILQPIIENHNVDLVLQGHDHTYGRTYKLKEDKVVGNNENGTVYVVSVSGPKSYKFNDSLNNIIAKGGTDIQLFQEISVNGNSLNYKAITADGKLYDSFEIVKSESNNK